MKNKKLVEAPTSREILKEALDLTGLSQYAFEKAAGMTKGGLNRYLTKPSGPQMNIRKLCTALRANGVASTWVLEVVDKNSQSTLRATSIGVEAQTQ
jgi:transcriptional regulator with XRE-family HTH domain